MFPAQRRQRFAELIIVAATLAALYFFSARLGWITILGLGLLALAGLAAAQSIPQRWLKTEAARRIVLGTAVLALVHPYLSNRFIGTADAKFYAEAMQDFLAQIKAGIFPVWISQTDIAPYGTVFPFRMSSYHFYLGALLNGLTGGTLNAYAVQHLALVLSAFGGAFAMYAALTALARSLRWESAALAFLYVACPGWLAALYGGDMYFTFMALPWLALVAYAIVRTFRQDDLWSFGLLGVALAMVWFAHSPVGFWASIAAGASQIARLAINGPSRRDFARLGLTVVIFAVLSAGLFVSLADVRITGEQLDPSELVLSNLRGVAPAVFLPVSASADRLSDFQLGYSLQLLLLAAACFTRTRAGERWTLVGIAAGLLMLIYPIPGLTSAVWHRMPYLVTNITNVWPMQRICPVVAALVPFAVLPALAASAHPRLRRALLASLCLWSSFEAVKFVRRGYRVTRTEEATRVDSKIENSPMLPAWSAYAPPLSEEVPLIGRVNDPRLLNRLLDAKTKIELVSNFGLAAGCGARVPPDAVFAGAVPLDVGAMRVLPAITLRSGQRYQLTLYFASDAPAGILQLLTLDPDPPFYQEIRIGANDARPPITATVWTSEPNDVPRTFIFRPDVPADATVPRPHFVAFHLQSYSAAALPIRVTSLAPYAATVDAPRACYLETHRLFVRGYCATVNGHPAAVSESPRHFAMLPLPPGRDEVRLDYVAPPAVRAAYWFSFAAWAGLAVWGLARLGAHARARIRLSPGP
jgi:hypothetical protein